MTENDSSIILQPLFCNVDHKRTAKQDGRFLNIVVLITDCLSLALISSLIWIAKSWLVSSSPQGANTTGLKQESWPILQCLAGPAHGKGAEGVAVGHDEDVAAHVVLFGLADNGFVMLLADVVDETV